MKLISKRVAALGTGALMLLGAFTAFGQVSRTIGTLPPGGTVTISFDVTINTPFPTNTASVTNQGSVTGTGFGPILTDNPSTPALNDPTFLAITVAPQIVCPSTITTNASGPCTLPAIPFAAAVTAGVPASTITYKLGATIITSPYVFPIGTNTVTVTAANGTTPDATCSFDVIVSAPKPQLTILPSGTNVVLSWPAAASCYTLQFSAVLPGNSWSNHPGPFVTNAGTIFATNNVSPSARFFRLRN